MIYLVFYTPAESEDERFLSAHASDEGARRAALDDAHDQGLRVSYKAPPRSRAMRRDCYRFGMIGVRNPNISGDVLGVGVEDLGILTDWTDPEGSASWTVMPCEVQP